VDFTPGDQDAIAAYATALRVSPEGYIRRTAAERVLSAAFRTVGIDPREVFGPFVHEQSTAIHQWCYNEVKIVSGGIVLPVMPSRDRPWVCQTSGVTRVVGATDGLRRGGRRR